MKKDSLIEESQIETWKKDRLKQPEGEASLNPRAIPVCPLESVATLTTIGTYP